jgi:hydroxyethylthiazole kinase-like uncharacterized protein yjeF
LHRSGASLLADLSADAVLFGPGFQDEQESCRLVEALLPQFAQATVVLDALAMSVVPRGAAREQALLLTPHAGEMAHLTGLAKEAVLADPARAAVQASRDWNAVVALKGASTWICSPCGEAWLHEGGDIGLATSGSGDALAGIIVGLAARGASVEQAAAWGVALHAKAGALLAGRQGRLGYLAREISAEIPALMQVLG